MEILVLGNGFDIASGLPTRYMDFLKMAELAASSIELPLQRELLQFNATVDETSQKINRFIGNMTNNEVEEFIRISKTNSWIDYFLNEVSWVGDKWIDFEECIRIVMLSLTSSANDVAKVEISSAIKRSVKRAHGDQISNYFETLEVDLRNLKRAMELYFDGYVRYIPVRKISEFSFHKYNHVISFNYTCTYGENYDARGEQCYIHGNADKNRKTDGCNLVLGFSHKTIENKASDLMLIPYEKYYQRIVNRTSNEFYRWIAELPSEEKIELVFFGHSMAVSDGDIIEKLICDERAQTLIYYLDEKDRADKIKNLAAVLGPEKLVELAGGIAPRVEFKKQM